MTAESVATTKGCGVIAYAPYVNKATPAIPQDHHITCRAIPSLHDYNAVTKAYVRNAGFRLFAEQWGKEGIKSPSSMTGFIGVSPGEGAKPDFSSAVGVFVSTALDHTGPALPLYMSTSLEDADRGLDNASTDDEIVDILRKHGLDEVADQVVALSSRLKADPDGPQPNVESLKRMAEAVLADDRLRSPSRITLNDEGFLHAEWDIEQGALAMTFRPSDHIRFAALYPEENGSFDLRVGGLLSRPDAMNAVQWLVSRIPAP